MSIPLKEMYRAVSRTPDVGIEGYAVEAKYVDPLKQVQERELAKVQKGQKSRKHETKRGNFLDDETKMREGPGPGQYPLKPEWSQKIVKHVKPSEKKTFLDEIIQEQKKQKRPAPGSYNVFKTLKQQQEENKKLAQRKIHIQDRTTYLDGIMYESSLLPGTGMYNPRKRAKTEAIGMKTKPEDWRKKHEAQDKKKPPKEPNMPTYSLFDQCPKVKENKNLPGKVQRFKTAISGSGLDPPRYNIIQKWKGKDNPKDAKERHGLEVLSKGHGKSVYYD